MPAQSTPLRRPPARRTPYPYQPHRRKLTHISTHPTIAFILFLLASLFIAQGAALLLQPVSQSGGPLTASERLLLTATLSPPQGVTLPPTLRPLQSKLFRTYPRWHTAQRVVWADGKELGPFGGRAPPEPRLLVYEAGPRQPGVGDRLVALASLYVHAAATRRVLLLHWRGPFSLRAALRPNFVDVYTRRGASATAQTAEYAEFASVSAGDVAYCTDPKRVASLAASTARVLVVNASVALRAQDAARLLGMPDSDALQERPGRHLGPLSAALLGRVLGVLFRPSPGFRNLLVLRAGPLLRGGFVAAHARLGAGVREGGPRFNTVDRACVADRLLSAALGFQSAACGSIEVAENVRMDVRVSVRRADGGGHVSPCMSQAGALGNSSSAGADAFGSRNGTEAPGAGGGSGYARVKPTPETMPKEGPHRPLRRIFVATDTPEFRAEMAEHAAGSAVVYAGGWDTRHVAHMRNDSRTDRRALWNSLVELVVLGRACRVVAMGSRFAVVGAMLGGMASDNVVDFGMCGTPAHSTVLDL